MSGVHDMFGTSMTMEDMAQGTILYVCLYLAGKDDISIPF